MPAVDNKLHDLRDCVQSNVTSLVSSLDSSLLSTLRQNRSSDEKKWYMFLHKYTNQLTQEQTEHVQKTFALLQSESQPRSDAAVIARSAQKRGQQKKTNV